MHHGILKVFQDAQILRNEINILDDSKKVIEILTKYKEEL